MGVISGAGATWKPLPRAPGGTLPHQYTTPPTTFPPTHSSHDVTPKRAPALSNITAHRAGETATDKPDECFAALRAEDVRATQVLIGGEFGEISLFLNQLLQSEVERKTLVRYKNRWEKKISQHQSIKQSSPLQLNFTQHFWFKSCGSKTHQRFKKRKKKRKKKR